MSDLPNNGLYQQAHARPKTGEELEVLGKTAASKWLDGREKNLNDAVISTVKHAGLAPEQVKRVCEFTNTEAFLREFRKESGVGHKVVDFQGGPADHGAVLQTLNSGGGGSVFDSGRDDYNTPPMSKKASTLKEDAVLAQTFGFAPDLTFENPLSDVMELRDKVAGAFEHLSSQVSGLEIMCQDTSETMYREVKQAALNGASLGDITTVLAAGAPDDRFLKIAFTQMTPRLLKEGVFPSLESAIESMDKTASHVVVDRTHPLVGSIREFSECLQKLAHTRAACAELNQVQAEATAFIKAAGNEGALVRVAKGAHNAAHKAAPHVGKAVGGAVKHLIGDDAGEKARAAAEWITRNSALGAGGLAAATVARHAANDPTANKLYHGAQANVNPFSNDWDQKNYLIQSGGMGFQQPY